MTNEKSLEIRINEWKLPKPLHNEFRSVIIEQSKFTSGEYDITLKMEMRVSEGAQSEKVTLKGKLKTTGQSGNEDVLARADLKLFDESASKLALDFQKKCAETYKRLSRIQGGDGFSERNPY